MSTTASKDIPAASSPVVSPAAVRLATVFGLGYSPVAPGTLGALAGIAVFLPLHYGLTGVPLKVLYLFLLCVLLPLALWSSEQAQAKWKTKDPQTIVIDETAGQVFTFAAPMLLFHFRVVEWNADWKILLAGFILFRVFDIWKPGLVSKAEQVGDARSIVFDDLAAGGYAGLVLALAMLAGRIMGI